MKTAIDWLLKEQFNLMMDYEKLSKKEYMGRKIRIQNKARELEKEQIDLAYLNGLIDSKNVTPKNYYEITFNQNNNNERTTTDNDRVY